MKSLLANLIRTPTLIGKEGLQACVGDILKFHNYYIFEYIAYDEKTKEHTLKSLMNDGTNIVVHLDSNINKHFIIEPTKSVGEPHSS